MDDSFRQAALDYHRLPKPGKISVTPTKSLITQRDLGLAYSPGFTDGALGKIFGGPGKTSIRMGFGLYYTSIEDLHLFYEVGDAPYGLYWPSIVPPLFEEPFRTRSDGTSQGQRFPFILPTPGDPANKTLDYSVFLPIQGSPGYDIHNRVPYAEHYNFTIQRSINSNTSLTLAAVTGLGPVLVTTIEYVVTRPGTKLPVSVLVMARSAIVSVVSVTVAVLSVGSGSG
jgi:hypothetical protein